MYSTTIISVPLRLIQEFKESVLKTWFIFTDPCELLFRPQLCYTSGILVHTPWVKIISLSRLSNEIDLVTKHRMPPRKLNPNAISVQSSLGARIAVMKQNIVQIPPISEKG